MVNIVEVNKSNFEEQVFHAELPVVLDVYAPWCDPCKALAPILEQLAQDYAGQAKFVKLNIDEAPEVAAACDITGVPTLLFICGGEVTDAVVGFGSPAILKSKIIELVGQNAGVAGS
jgi:thioredoxin 1